MNEGRGSALAMRRTTGRVIESYGAHASRVDQRLLELRCLVERNEVVFRADQNQYVLTDAVGNRSKRVGSERFSRILDVLRPQRPECVLVPPCHVLILPPPAARTSSSNHLH